MSTLAGHGREVPIKANAHGPYPVLLPGIITDREYTG